MHRRVSMLHLSTLAALVVLIVMMSPTGSIIAKAQVASGDVVGQGTLSKQADQTVCDFPETTFGQSNDASVSESVMVVEVTQNCQLVVTSVDKKTSSMSRVASTWHEGAAWTEHHDCCGIVLTEAFAYMQYYDDGSTVYGGSSPSPVCRVFPDGWLIESVAWGMLGDGPSSVSTWNRCTFDFYDGSCYHTLDATFYGWPGGAWDHYCSIYGGIVPGGHLECGGNWN